MIYYFTNSWQDIAENNNPFIVADSIKATGNLDHPDLVQFLKKYTMPHYKLIVRNAALETSDKRSKIMNETYYDKS
jgi:hypothetical protein